MIKLKNVKISYFKNIKKFEEKIKHEELEKLIKRSFYDEDKEWEN